MKSSTLSLLFCSSAIAVLPLGLRAAPGDAMSPQNRPTSIESRVELKSVDRHFLETAAKSSLEEIEISRVAIERTSNPKVREFAQMLLSEHQAANESLAVIAAGRGVSLPAKSTEASWSKKDAKTFDRDYLDKMISTHEDAVKLFQKETTEGVDPETVAFARKTLTKLQHHLEQANDLKRLMK